jgi:hypothetical protein
VNAKAMISLLVIALIAIPLVCQGQQQGANDKPPADGPVPAKKLTDLKFKHQSFTFVRIQFSSDHPSSAWWIDYPAADSNLTARFQQVTGLMTEREGKVMSLTSAELKRYPFIYIVEGSAMRLSAAEVRSLRAYLLGGGFLMVDDFWGEEAWQRFSAQMKLAFPEREPVELAIEHPVFHCFYDIREKPQVPNVMLGIRSQFTGITWERADAKEPHYRGLFDDNGRLMAIFCHNTDLGDGWEREGENQYYFKEFSLKKAYPMGINIVVYALTH